MRTIRFWTSHNCRDGESWRKRLYLPEEFRFVFDEANPEYLLVSEHLYAAVRRVDEDDALWKKMIAAPYKTAEQLARVAGDFERVKAFSLRVFDERSAAEKKRAPSGYWNGIYRSAVARQFAERRRRGLFGRMFG